MAWRPHEYLIEGELDNTTPCKVTGWMRFVGKKERVTFDLNGDFHRDIRGAKIRFTGDGDENNPKAADYMAGIAPHQTGDVGDITAGLPPHDYTKYPYLEWYSDDNGRVVIELEPEQVEVIGQPIPICESDPISREQQANNMANFLAGVSTDAQVPVIMVGGDAPIVSDPAYSHWVVTDGNLIGEAHSVGPEKNGYCVAYVRLFVMPEMAEFGPVDRDNLRSKTVGLHEDAANQSLPT